MDYERGVALLQQGRAPEAREALEAALRAQPAHAGARQTLTGLLIDANAYSEAERLLHEGLRVPPSHSGYAIALARPQVYRSDVAAAIEALQKHAEQNADYQVFLPRCCTGSSGMKRRSSVFTRLCVSVPRAQ